MAPVLPHRRRIYLEVSRVGCELRAAAGEHEQSLAASNPRSIQPRGLNFSFILCRLLTILPSQQFRELVRSVFCPCDPSGLLHLVPSELPLCDWLADRQGCAAMEHEHGQCFSFCVLCNGGLSFLSLLAFVFYAIVEVSFH